MAYAAAKAGLAQAARTLALEWARDGIRVNTVAPWYTRTPLVEPVLRRPESLSRDRRAHAARPRRRAARGRHRGRVPRQLPAASYITGQWLAVDGGMTIQGLAPS